MCKMYTSFMTNIANWAMGQISKLLLCTQDNALVGQNFTTSSFFKFEHMGLR